MLEARAAALSGQTGRVARPGGWTPVVGDGGVSGGGGGGGIAVVGVVVEMEVEVVGMVVVEVVEAGTSWKYLYNFHRNIMKVVDIYYHKTHNLMDQTKNPMSSNKAYYNK